MAGSKLPSELYIKFFGGKMDFVEIPPGCRKVGHLIRAIKSQFPNKLEKCDPDNITLYTTEDGDALKFDDPLENAYLDENGEVMNDKAHPLIVKVSGAPPISTGESHLELLRRGLMCG
ncbi:hypothetical protein HK102_000659 [Quaeritorhiza haematococci]|nr:hypothetical protein HK102_000659 [Quaeritorhiza haematococci]